MARFGRTGFGRFLTVEDLAFQRQAPAWMILSNQIGFGFRTDLVDARGTQRSLQISGPGLKAWCTPVYFIDGVPFRAEEWVALNAIEVMVEQDRVEGIETYSPWYVPDEFHAHFSSKDSCAVGIWTKEPEN